MPPITVDLNGKAHNLRLLHSDLSLAEYKSGMCLMGAMAAEFWDLAKGTSYKIAVLLWASMLHENPNLGLEEVRSWITYQNAVEVEAAVTAVIERDMQQVVRQKDELEDQEPSEDPFSGTTGSTPAPSPDSTSI